MANQRNIIELNGKRYDAITGDIVTTSGSRAAVKPPKTTPRPVPTPSGSLDGFSRAPKTTPLTKQATQISRRKTQSSKTLMRKSVKRPQPIVKQPTSQRSSPGSAPTFIDGTRLRKTLTDPERLQRAEHIHKSNLISKFSDALPRKLGQPSLLPLTVAPTPEAPQLGKVATKALSQPFQNALDQATSHQQVGPKRPPVHHRIAKKVHISPRLLSVGAASLAVLLVGGFIAYQNVPNLAMRVASARAGIHASMPSYRPAGFAINGPIIYKPGQITVSFKSNTDSARNFSITQSVSSWNSETLLENYVSANKQPFQTYQNNGKTIYIYNGSNATWVDGGIWYNVQGNSSLNSDQLLRIANSI